MLPNLKDLVLAVNKALSGLDWNNNWQKIVNWLTSGKYDIKVKSIELAQDGGIVNNGSFTQNGDLTVDGDLEVTKDVTVDGKITGDGSGLYNLVSQGVQAFTPFSVNSGYLNSGNGDLISATPVSEGGDIVRFDIDFKVDDGTTYGKLKATTANGSTFVLEQLNSDKLASNGTFYYFIGQGQTATIRLPNITIYRQPTQPASSINDVWLDTSKEELISYKCNDNGIWERWDYVPIGKVVIANIGSASATATVTTFSYNQNGYTVNGRSELRTGITKYALEHLSNKTVGTSYLAEVPTLVIVGNSYSAYNGDEWYLQVSVDNSTWVKVLGHKIASGDPSNGVLQNVVIDAGLYYKATQVNTPINFYKSAPIYEYSIVRP